MRNLTLWLLLASSTVTLITCRGKDETPTKAPVAAARPVPRGVPQVSPPPDLEAPPDDATKTASGLIYKRLVANSAGAQLRGDETALVRYTGWRQRTGQTFFTTTGADHPIAIDVAHAAAGFREALPLLHQGEKIMLWLPAGTGSSEAIAYEIELVGTIARPVAAAAKVTAADRGAASPANATSHRVGGSSSGR